MKTVTTVSALRAELDGRPGVTIGLVPTMGALHEGHLSLVRASRAENDLTVVSVFVNPLQFGPSEDFTRYPRNLAQDARLLAEAGTDLLFAPTAEEIYPPGHQTLVSVTELERELCGKSRPGHFRGVATVVLSLFHIVTPQRAYFGTKDAQQAILIARMVRDLHLRLTVRPMPIVRDPDGLALSSRNAYLSAEERQAALHLPRGLTRAREMVAAGQTSAAPLRQAILAELGGSPLIQVEYCEVVSTATLTPLATVRPEGTLVACAIRVGATRLIDNFVVGRIG